MSTAVVFPGMGPSVQVAKYLLVNRYGRDLLARADDVLGYPLIERYRTEAGAYSEPAQVLFVLACLTFAQSIEDSPDLVAGPSFGGRATAAYTGVLEVDETIWLTARLARLMSAYFTAHHTGVVTHSFVRVPESELRPILTELTWHEISGQIDDDFFMVSTRTEQLEWLKRRLAAVGGLSLYTMWPPMHASVFADLRDRVDDEIFAKLTWSKPAVPVVADQDGSIRDTGDGVRTMLLDGFVRAVRWPSVVTTLRQAGVRTVHVAGPDGMFTRVPGITRNFSVVRAGQPLQSSVS